MTSPLVIPSLGQKTLFKLFRCTVLRPTFTSRSWGPSTAFVETFDGDDLRGAVLTAFPGFRFAVMGSFFTVRASLSARKPRKTGCRMCPSRVHSVNLML